MKDILKLLFGYFMITYPLQLCILMGVIYGIILKIKELIKK